MKNSYLKLTLIFFCLVTIISACRKDNIDICLNSQCLNGGICLDGSCDCPERFSGQNCEVERNLCESINCLNGGDCINGSCNCPDGFTGENCGIQVQNDYCQTESGGTDNHNKPQSYNEFMLFKGRTEGYHTFRNPAIIRTANQGTLIAFCEARKDSHEDYGNIDLVYKRSTDNGDSWSSLQLVWGAIEPGTIGNATPVLDTETGKIWLFMSYNDENHAQILNGSPPSGYDGIDEWGDRRVYSMTSSDDGITWSNRRNLTSDLVPPDHCWDAVGPGNGIQLKHGPYAGRLIIPAHGRNIFSDDHGVTWKYQQITQGTSEGTIVELCDGTLMRNDRGSCLPDCPEDGENIDCTWRDRNRRQISTSTDNGETWTNWESDEELLDPTCQASFIRYNEDYPARLIFVNPASTKCRYKMRVRISYDEGQSWPIQRCINSDCNLPCVNVEECNDEECNPSNERSIIGGYSSIAKTDDFHLACLHSTGKNRSDDNRYSIIFKKFNIPWILNGTPEPVD